MGKTRGTSRRGLLATVSVSGLMAMGTWATAATAQGDMEGGATRARQQLSMTEELLWTQQVFQGATAGSPAQWRARESADALAARIYVVRPPR